MYREKKKKNNEKPTELKHYNKMFLLTRHYSIVISKRQKEYKEGIGQNKKKQKDESILNRRMVGDNHTANAVGSLFVLQRHIARRPTLGNAKHVRGARRRSLFGGALVCIVCAGRDAVPLSVRPSIACEGPSLGPNRDLLLYYYYYYRYYYYYYYFNYLPTYWISVLLRCAVRHPGWLARSLLPE